MNVHAARSDHARGVFREAVHASVAGLLAILAAFAVMQLWNVDLRLPLEPHGDGLLHTVMVQGALEEGWPLVIERLGAPGKLDFRDFPALDNFNLLLIRIVGFAIPDATLLVNVFFLLTFALVAASAFAVARRIGLSVYAGYLVAILYALLPYHFGRATGHLFLSAYYIVPVAVLLAVEIARGEPLFVRLPAWRAIFAIATSIILGSSGVYYPFFGCFFILLAGVSGALVRKSLRPLATASIIAGIVLATVAANHLPTILKEHSEGSLEVARREAREAEMYGLKISQLLLPVSGHRISDWARAKQRYNAATLVTESDMSALGLIGSAGFLLLFAWLFWIKPQALAMHSLNGPLNHLSVLNAGGVLYATIGGFASIFALFVSPQIRSVNRISVFIAFFSLVAAGIAFDHLFGWRTPRIAPFAAAMLVVVGGLDETSPNFARSRSDPNTETAFRGYVAAIETSLGAGSSVFQLPYYPFPEHGSIGMMSDYDHFRPFLESSGTAWSYGAVRGSVGDLWQKGTAALPPGQMVAALVHVGFDGIWIDRRGYPDRAVALEQELSRATGAVPFESEGGDYSFFPLGLARYRLSRGVSAAEWKARETDALGRLLVSWRAGFSGPERQADREWRWGSRRGEMMIHNLGREPRNAIVRFEVETGRDEPSELEISSELWNERLSLGADPLLVQRTIAVPPGMHRVRFRSTAKPVVAPGDPRVLVFQVRDFQIDAWPGSG